MITRVTAAGLQAHDFDDCIITEKPIRKPPGVETGIKMVNTRELLLDYMKYRYS